MYLSKNARSWRRIRARTLKGATNQNAAFFESIQSECRFSKNPAFWLVAPFRVWALLRTRVQSLCWSCLSCFYRDLLTHLCFYSRVLSHKSTWSFIKPPCEQIRRLFSHLGPLKRAWARDCGTARRSPLTPTITSPLICNHYRSKSRLCDQTLTIISNSLRMLLLWLFLQHATALQVTPWESSTATYY